MQVHAATALHYLQCNCHTLSGIIGKKHWKNIDDSYSLGGDMSLLPRIMRHVGSAEIITEKMNAMRIIPMNVFFV